jgi:two-component system, cell cycle sensor histidine kinase and response regulator CckA
MRPDRGVRSADDERRRLESLWRLDVLDRPPDREIADVVDLMAWLLDAPYAALTFVDEDRAWSCAVRGRETPLEVPREASPAGLVVGSGRQVVDLHLDSLQDAGTGMEEHPLLAGDPPLRRVAAAALQAPDGQCIGAIEVAWDDRDELGDRDRRTLERAVRHVGRLLELRGEVEEYRRFVELSPDAVMVLDLEGCIELANPALGQLLDRRSEELVGRPFLELVAPRDADRVATQLARVLFERTAMARFDLGLVSANGPTVQCSVTAGHLRGSRRSLQLAIRDLDERIRGEEERARLSEQLAQAQRLDLAGQLANGLAHDLKNLLMVMRSNLDLAAESLGHLDADEEALRPLAEDLEQVRVAVDRAGQLTTKLTQFARREPAGTAEVSLSEALDAVRGLLGGAVPDSVALRIELEDGLPGVAADPVQLEQTLVNLVMNACDALPEGGTITVRAVHISSDELTLGGAGAGGDPDEHVYIEVHDDGVGMSDETRARAFEPLFTTKGASRGTGLGLPTVLAFVQEVGGAVDLASKPGEGTTVTLLLPTAVPAMRSTVPVEEPDSRAGGARVLLVDAGDQARRVITQMLESAGYRVRPVATAEDAVEALRVHGADLLITELSLPGMSGWRLVERLRAEEPELRALVFSSTESDVGIDGVQMLVKPFSHDRLLRTLEELLPPRH